MRAAIARCGRSGGLKLMPYAASGASPDAGTPGWPSLCTTGDLPAVDDLGDSVLGPARTDLNEPADAFEDTYRRGVVGCDGGQDCSDLAGALCPAHEGPDCLGCEPAMPIDRKDRVAELDNATPATGSRRPTNVGSSSARSIGRGGRWNPA